MRGMDASSPLRSPRHCTLMQPRSVQLSSRLRRHGIEPWLRRVAGSATPVSLPRKTGAGPARRPPPAAIIDLGCLRERHASRITGTRDRASSPALSPHAKARPRAYAVRKPVSRHNCRTSCRDGRRASQCWNRATCSRNSAWRQMSVEFLALDIVTSEEPAPRIRRASPMCRVTVTGWAVTVSTGCRGPRPPAGSGVLASSARSVFCRHAGSPFTGPVLGRTRGRPANL